MKHRRLSNVTGAFAPVAPRMTIPERREKEKAAAEERQYPRPSRYYENTKQKLEMILSTHVDDLKGGARKDIALRLLAHLEKQFGPRKQPGRLSRTPESSMSRLRVAYFAISGHI